MKENRLHKFWPINDSFQMERRLIFEEAEKSVPEQPAPDEEKKTPKDKKNAVKALIDELMEVDRKNVEKMHEKLEDVLAGGEEEVENFASNFYMMVDRMIKAGTIKREYDLDFLLPTGMDDVGWIALSMGMSWESIECAMSGRGGRKQLEDWEIDQKAAFKRYDKSRKTPKVKLIKGKEKKRDEKSVVERQKRLEKVIADIRAADQQVSHGIMAKRRMRRIPMARRSGSDYGKASAYVGNGFRSLAMLKNEYEELTGESWVERVTRMETVRKETMKDRAVGGRKGYEQRKANVAYERGRRDAREEARLANIPTIGQFSSLERSMSPAARSRVYEERQRHEQKMRQRQATWESMGYSSQDAAELSSYGSRRMPQSQVGYTPQQWEEMRRYKIPPPSGVHFVSNRSSGDRRQMHRGGFGRSYEIDPLPSEGEIRDTNDRIIDRNRGYLEDQEKEIARTAGQKFRNNPEFMNVYESILERHRRGSKIDPDHSLKQFTDENDKLTQYHRSVTFAQNLLRDAPKDHPVETIQMPRGLQSSGMIASERVSGEGQFTIGFETDDGFRTLDFRPFARPTHLRPFGGVDSRDLQDLAEAGIVLVPNYGNITTDPLGRGPHIVISSVDVHFIKNGRFDIPGRKGQMAIDVEGEITKKSRLGAKEEGERHEEQFNQKNLSTAELTKYREGALFETSFTVPVEGYRDGAFSFSYDGKPEQVKAPFYRPGVIAIIRDGQTRTLSTFRIFYYRNPSEIQNLRLVSEEGHALPLPRGASLTKVEEKKPAEVTATQLKPAAASGPVASSPPAPSVPSKLEAVPSAKTEPTSETTPKGKIKIPSVIKAPFEAIYNAVTGRQTEVSKKEPASEAVSAESSEPATDEATSAPATEAAPAETSNPAASEAATSPAEAAEAIPKPQAIPQSEVLSDPSELQNIDKQGWYNKDLVKENVGYNFYIGAGGSNQGIRIGLAKDRSSWVLSWSNEDEDNWYSPSDFKKHRLDAVAEINNRGAIVNLLDAMEKSVVPSQEEEPSTDEGDAEALDDEKREGENGIVEDGDAASLL
ncbi:MAG: hypothetical protein ABIA92_04785 [Patescibacteria group bacterium]